MYWRSWISIGVVIACGIFVGIPMTEDILGVCVGKFAITSEQPPQAQRDRADRACFIFNNFIAFVAAVVIALIVLVQNILEEEDYVIPIHPSVPIPDSLKKAL